MLDGLRLRIFDFVMSRRVTPFVCSIYEFEMARLRKFRGKDDEVCPLCGGVMLFRHSVLAFSPYRDDIGLKCPSCFHTLHVGVPITKAMYEREVVWRQGRFFMRPTYNKAEWESRLVREKLKALGYLEG